MTFVGTMANTKEERIYIRVTEEIRDEFDLVAEHVGLTRSGLLHSMIVKKIHDVKKEEPEVFTKKAAKQPKSKIPTKTLEEIKDKRGKNK